MKRILRFPDGRRKALTLSYDDAVLTDRQLMAIWRQYGLKGTFNVNSGRLLTEEQAAQDPHPTRRMTLREAQALYCGSGMEIAVHGYDHPAWAEMPVGALAEDIERDRLELEALWGAPVQGSAAPYGSMSDTVVQTLAACGIRYCRTVNATRDFRLPEDLLRWDPTCHHNDPQLFSKAEAFLAEEGEWPQLFYLWGHSYEFEQSHNWDRMEQFAAAVSGREDVWYATNGAIADYLEAYRRLRWSAAGDRVTNPSAQPVWVAANGTTVCIQPGETVPVA